MFHSFKKIIKAMIVLENLPIKIVKKDVCNKIKSVEQTLQEKKINRWQILNFDSHVKMK